MVICALLARKPNGCNVCIMVLLWYQDPNALSFITNFEILDADGC